MFLSDTMEGCIGVEGMQLPIAIVLLKLSCKPVKWAARLLHMQQLYIYFVYTPFVSLQMATSLLMALCTDT